MYQSVFIVGALCLCLTSCANTSTNRPLINTTRSRVTPTTYDGWQSKSFEYIGLKVDLPDQAQVSPSAKGPATLSIAIHYLSPPLGLVDDATVFVRVYVDRITLEEFAEQKASYLRSGLYKQETDEEHKIWFWFYAFHSETSRSDGGGNYSYYRRDVKLNDKDILHVHAEVLNAGPQESRAADHAAVKRIIDSIEPLTSGVGLRDGGGITSRESIKQ